jgi:hypothetical protein
MLQCSVVTVPPLKCGSAAVPPLFLYLDSALLLDSPSVLVILYQG